MRIAFFGTPAYAVPTLNALVESGADVVTVVSVPENVSSVAAPLDGVIVHLALVMSEALKPEGKAYEQVIFPP